MKRRKRLVSWLFVATCAAIIVVFLVHLILRPSPSQMQTEQYIVYSAFIQPEFTADPHDLRTGGGPVVIHGSTMVSDQFINSRFHQYRYLLGTASHTKALIPQLRASVLFEFLIANLLDMQFTKQFTLNVRYELATEQETYLSTSEQFRKRFPDSYGYLTFSRIGFNRDLSEALFYTEHVCDLCGEEKYVYMRKVNGRWIVDTSGRLIDDGLWRALLRFVSP